MKSRKIALLCSGAGLGFYVPGLIMECQLKKKGISTEVFVIETYLKWDKQEQMIESKKTYHENFSIAIIAQRMPRDIRASFDYAEIDKLLESMAKQGIEDFIVFSGHWMYILDMYREQVSPKAIKAELVYVDSDLSPSWRWLKKYKPDYSRNCHEVWFFNFENMQINYRLSVGAEPPIPFELRNDRYIIHGGGWGMGTYQNIIPELEKAGMALDIVIYDMSELKNNRPQNRYFMIDPLWCAWKKEAGFQFPPFGEINNSEAPKFTNREQYHESFDITREARGIISKPGGGTLIDSLASATPIIFLESFGKHEQKNAELWIQHGFGITYDRWRESGFSSRLLRDLHINLMNAANLYQDYVKSYLAQISNISVAKALAK
jgi:UDP-N-acetylglucosamine:LPS N-acetylglucosamine transferase